jgi:uncharacterized protein (TIGR02452 family)
LLRLGLCLDDAARAEARKRELDIDPDRAAQLGRSALEASQQGWYSDEQGNQVAWGAAIAAATAAKRSVAPGDALPATSGASFAETRVSVANETTLAAARVLIERGLRPLALNFANGVQPGGGFLLGARAQEEVLCRSSALFSTLLGDRMYAANRRFAPHASSDWLILSPEVPVFRNDDGSDLPRPWLLSFATCAAPYAPAVGQPQSGDLLQKRIDRLFEVASAHGYDTLVLGAWGCGAFANDPSRTARDFRAALEAREGLFREVVFAIADWSAERRYLGPFRDAFLA